MENHDLQERWENYRKANSERPLVRDLELKRVFNLLNPIEGEKILEVGTGNGYLTFPIAQSVKSGEVITADVREDNLESVVKRNVTNLPVKTFLFNDENLFSDLRNDSFDAVATIATLHHFDSRKKGTGETGRVKALRDFYRILKVDGRIALADVVSGSISQKYFDAIDNPQHCFPEGHPHNFFTKERLIEVLTEIGFKDIKVEIVKVPWQFGSEEEARDFVHTIHNAKCTPEESLEVAKRELGFTKVGDFYELGWELFFATARK